MSAEEAILVHRAQRGDERAFIELIRPCEKPLFNVALRMVGNVEDARDLTQTALLKAFRGLGGFDGRHRFFSWIYRIMINETLNLVTRRRPVQPLTDTLPAGGRSPEEETSRSETAALVQGALLELPPHAREAIVLRHFVQLSYREMSDALGIPEKTVKSRLYSARQVLGQALRRRGVQP